MNYQVTFEDYAVRHYLKKFRKKYRHQWSSTEDGIRNKLARIDSVIDNQRIEVIHCTDDKQELIVKDQFKIAQSKKSAKTSGDRIIAHVDRRLRLVKVLLIYHKGDLPKKRSETSQWRVMIGANYKRLLANFNLSNKT